MAELFSGGPSAEDRICKALADNLLSVYPNGPPADEKQIKKWMDEIVSFEGITIQIRQEISACDGEEFDSAMAKVYERGLERAVKEWKLKAAEKSTETKTAGSDGKKKKSFSLFDQMDQGLWGAPRISIEEIQSATTLEERLQVLERVAHVDDLMLDWQEVLSLLREGINQGTEETRINLWMLHRKWFDQGRASLEHLPIRFDLCQNVLEAVSKTVITQWEQADWRLQDDKFTENQEYIIDLWNLWFEMFYDLLQQPVGVDEDTGPLGTMGRKVLFLMRGMDFPPGSKNSEEMVYPAHLLAFVDPTATWFQAWAARMTPVELLGLANFGELCPDLWKRAATGSDTGVLLPQHGSNSQLLRVALRQHSLSIIKSILACTRLQWFPSACIWENNSLSLKPQRPLSLDTLKQEFGNGTYPGQSKVDWNQSYVEFLSPFSGITSEQTECLFALFLKVGNNSDQVLVKPIASICAEAIEIILLGVRLSPDAVKGAGCLPSLIAQCQARTSINDKGCFNNLLSKVLEDIKICDGTGTL